MTSESLFHPASGAEGVHDTTPGTITVYSDIGCPWASLALFHLRAQRAQVGQSGGTGPVIEHRAFPLELFNRRGTPKTILDAEIAVITSTEPALGWGPWRRPDSEYPVTMLPAMEAVQAARDPEIGGAAGADELDGALRRAFYVDSRNISLITEINEIAEECQSVDADRLQWTLRRGVSRAALHDQFDIASGEVVQGSPQLFLHDGRRTHNPGVRFSWTAPYGQGFPVIHEYRPGVWRDIVTAATETAPEKVPSH